MPTEATLDHGPNLSRRTRNLRGIVIVAVVAGSLATCTVVLSVRAERRVNHTPLAASARDVTVLRAKRSTYRPSRSYVGAVEPWLEASIGPQYVSAYVRTVLVRPGAIVHQGQVLATLDCSNPSAKTRAIAMRAQAIDAEMRATTSEAKRVSSMLDGGFVSPNDVEQKNAAGAASRAQLQETRATLASAALDVSDCVLRAPFEAEVGTRTFDPGAFVHPGASIVSIVDRRTSTPWRPRRPSTSSSWRPAAVSTRLSPAGLRGRIPDRARSMSRSTFPTPTGDIPSGRRRWFG
jgi:multidrug efflux pump subunit AcrA (membrane-fusion protein)